MYYKEYYYIDKLMRAALYGTTEEMVKAFGLLNALESETAESDNYRITAIHQVRQILIRRGDSESLTEFSGLCGEDIKTEGFLSDNVEKYPFRILSACLYGNDDILRHVLVRCSTCHDLLWYRFFHNPLYILMICKKYDIIAEVLEKINRADYDPSCYGGYAARSLFVMAAVFREERMLRMLLEAFSWENLYDIIPELALFPESIEYIAENFYTYTGFEKRDEPPTLSEFLNAEHMCGTKLKLLHNIYCKNEPELLDYYLERLSPVSVLTSVDNTCWEIYKLVPRDDEIGRIFADEVKILYRSGNNCLSIDSYRRLFKVHKLSFDLSKADASDIRYNTAEELRYLLTHSADFPVSDGISPMTELFLSCGSRRLTALMLSKGIINKDNYGDAAAFLAQNRKLAALDELNKAVF
ncbi:MAG: hypothetical protein J5999_06330 [Oscillospiraceae bacterium]|nr:hypothetical protein [Oscillospiraceae bacterium]